MIPNTQGCLRPLGPHNRGLECIEIVVYLLGDFNTEVFFIVVDCLEHIFASELFAAGQRCQEGVGCLRDDVREGERASLYFFSETVHAGYVIADSGAQGFLWGELDQGGGDRQPGAQQHRQVQGHRDLAELVEPHLNI